MKETDEGIIIPIKVCPRSHRIEVIGWKDDELWIRLTSSPIDGEANEELIRFVAKILDTNKTSVKLISGHKNPHKRVLVENISKADCLKKLGNL